MNRVGGSIFFNYFLIILALLVAFESTILFSFITTARIYMLLLILLFLGTNGKIKFQRIFVTPVIVLTTLTFIVFSNSLWFLTIGKDVSFNNSVSFGILTICTVLLAIMLYKNRIDFIIFAKYLSIIGCISIFTTYIYLLNISDFNPFDFTQRLAVLKNFFNENLVSGSNRYYYGLITLNIFTIGYALNYIESNKIFRYASRLSLLFLIILIIYANSRQNILFLIAIALIPKIFEVNSLKIVKISLGIVAIIILGVFVIKHNWIPTSIKEKYINRTLAQFEKGSERTITYNKAINSSIENPIMGLGSGNFEKEYGITTHNGYLWLLVEFGGLALLLFIFLSFWIFFLKRKVLNSDLRQRPYTYMLFSYCLAFLSVSNNFNELTRDYSFYFFLAILVAVLKSKGSETNIISSK